MDVRTEWRGDHLLATVGGAFDPQAARHHLALMLQACAEKGVARILIDARGIATSVSVADRFDLGSQIAARGPPLIRVAILVSRDNMFTKTLEDVAANRGALVRTTDSPEEARAFLGIVP